MVFSIFCKKRLSLLAGFDYRNILAKAIIANSWLSCNISFQGWSRWLQPLLFHINDLSIVKLICQCCLGIHTIQAEGAKLPKKWMPMKCSMMIVYEKVMSLEPLWLQSEPPLWSSMAQGWDFTALWCLHSSMMILYGFRLASMEPGWSKKK